MKKVYVLYTRPYSTIAIKENEQRTTRNQLCKQDNERIV